MLWRANENLIDGTIIRFKAQSKAKYNTKVVSIVQPQIISKEKGKDNGFTFQNLWRRFLVSGPTLLCKIIQWKCQERANEMVMGIFM